VSLAPANATKVYQNTIKLAWRTGRTNYQQSDQFQLSASPTQNSKHIKAGLNTKLKTEETIRDKNLLFLGGVALF
jgi:hypothetical protein